MNRLKTLREDRGINQRRLADELNVSQAMISKYELSMNWVCQNPILLQ